MRRRAHPIGWQQHRGQVNLKSVIKRDQPPPVFHQEYDPLIPDCVIFVSKRKGFGSTGNKESFPLPIHSAALLEESFPKESFQRYRVCVYLKEEGHSDARRKSRGW